jgi:mycofactocin glycosyltransferase
VTAPAPRGLRLVLDANTRRLAPDVLVGGSPARLLRLSERGRAAWAELLAGPVGSPASATLARRLIDAGLAHPRPTSVKASPTVTVLIPVRDRAPMLDECLTALGRRHPVVVVDDGSAGSSAVAAVVARHSARLVRRADNGGPAAARNTGLAQIDSEFVAFLDSDCVPPAGWVDALAAHFCDPLVAAVAPRIVPAASAASAGRYRSACGSLDLGDRAAGVQPYGWVSYVPTAALLVRRAALCDLGPEPDVFDPALRFGEDVDLVWRLDAAGWRVRYDPSVEVRHDEPTGWAGRLGRRYRYGTSAGPLARRHPAALAPLVVQPWPMLAALGLLTRRPAVAAAGLVGSAITAGRVARRAGLPAADVPRMTGGSVVAAWLGIGRYATTFAAPVLAASILRPEGVTSHRRWGARAAAASLVLAPPVGSWLTRRPDVDLARYVAGRVADDVAYGAGVYAGCGQARTVTPLRPIRSRRLAGRRPTNDQGT